MRWEKESSSYRRGAWVCLYGVPLHAWNEQFFQLCVFESGRFLRTDCCSVGKNRLDFARVLIATPELDLIKSSVTALVDGIQVEIKIVEEWGYSMGEDSCLIDEESESEESQADCGEGHVDPEVYRSVDMLVERFKEGLEEEEPNEVQGMRDKEIFDESDARPVSSRAGTLSVLRKGSQDLSGVQEGKEDTSTPMKEAHMRPTNRSFFSKRTSSCPPEARRSVLSGPWSLEWLQDQNHGDAGVIFSASKRSRKALHQGPKFVKKGEQDRRRRKAGGPLRHPLHSIKKVARMPSKDRCEVLKVLKKSVRRRRGGDEVNRSCSLSRQASSGGSSSSVSVNNDWKNWVAVQGNDQMAVDDVWGIGKAIGVKFKGDNVNMFQILSRAGKGKKRNSGQVSGAGGTRKVDGC
ncbi:uncharacterized protein LOC123891756 [Trifolium pratense]|uniref:uncharacterized protein LOC123891756 n=1 Tax=Trifolium pratense TaxID=57577 RepID=UPI001E6959B9|nr:uncharacterized protein LOC123891756 [Trifolium pratense]